MATKERAPTAAPKLLLAARAIGRLISDDAILFEYLTNERTVSFRLGLYLQDAFRDWNVDCEYNRRENLTKRLAEEPDKWIAPDILVHKRGKQQNLLCFEMKPDRRKKLARDREKLIGLTRIGGGYEYDFGILLVFDAPTAALAFTEVYTAGAIDSRITHLFTAMLVSCRAIPRIGPKSLIKFSASDA